MAGHTYQLQQRAAGWRVLTLDPAGEAERDFASLDEALEWCGGQEPLAIRMPDDTCLAGTRRDPSPGHDGAEP